jgi:cytochrome c556
MGQLPAKARRRQTAAGRRSADLEERGEFREAGQLAAQAAKLARTTAASDSAQVKSEIKVVVATCKSCHRDYRSN